MSDESLTWCLVVFRKRCGGNAGGTFAKQREGVLER